MSTHILKLSKTFRKDALKTNYLKVKTLKKTFLVLTPVDPIESEIAESYIVSLLIFATLQFTTHYIKSYTVSLLLYRGFI